MYVPSRFAESDPARLRTFVEQYSFATIVTTPAGRATASHIPLLPDGDFQSGGHLMGHFAKANPQSDFSDGETVLAIFHGPHAYISPSWYGTKNAVPTWNYVTVHVYGTMHAETDRLRQMQMLRRFVDFHEASLPTPWSPDQADADFNEQLLSAIVCFRIKIDHIEGNWKLNQHHDTNRRRSVIDALSAADSENQQQIAKLMSQTLPPS
ncbi:MAG: FMN-binding negative transcriptional regulator [Planctomycetaceae bacterium]|nr:FMN-binding negative transcriptional regulator [Planctomycetaceae bacterium]